MCSYLQETTDLHLLLSNLACAKFEQTRSRLGRVYSPLLSQTARDAFIQNMRFIR